MRPPLTPEQLLARQREYDALVDWFTHGTPVDRASGAALQLHTAVVRILNGEDPDPRPGKGPRPGGR